MNKPSIAFVVPTRNRSEELRRLLESVARQTVHPRQIVIVDASDERTAPNLEFSELNLLHIFHQPPSAAGQRNAGVLHCDEQADLIAFIDDDVVLHPGALDHMLAFWAKASPDVLGAAFDVTHFPVRQSSVTRRRSRLAQWLGLYPSQGGRVAQSGWHSAVGGANSTKYVDWLPTTAIVWRRAVLETHRFDEFFEGYSYLEDLDFSYRLSRRGKLAVVAGTDCSHVPSQAGRVSARRFGRFEVKNRLYFVRKHGLSLGRCYLCLAIRMTMSAGGGLIRGDRHLLARAGGNLEELCAPFLP